MNRQGDEEKQMLELKVVIPNKLAVMPQPTPEDVKALAEQGYRSIINNRPDNEKPGQPKAADVRAAAKQHGLHYEHMPVTIESITREDVFAFRQSFTLAPPPVAAHCATGRRSYLLWAAGEVVNAGRPVQDLIDQGAAIGIDAKDLQQVMDRISKEE